MRLENYGEMIDIDGQKEGELKETQDSFFFLVNIMPIMRTPESPAKCWIPIQTENLEMRLLGWIQTGRISGKISKMLDTDSEQFCQWKSYMHAEI